MDVKSSTLPSLQVDPNTGVAMYESDDIIKYLVEKYGVLPIVILSLIIIGVNLFLPMQ